MIDLDITFCWGQLETEKEIVICPKRDRCQRFWNNEYREYAKKTGDVYHSFLLMNKPEDITSCSNFIQKGSIINIEKQEDQLVHAALEGQGYGNREEED